MSVILPGFSVQLLVSLSAPIQSFPHVDGGGLVQVLVRVRCPSPHVLLHDEKLDHGVYWPLIGAIMIIKNKDNRVGSLRKRVFLFMIKQYTRFSKKRFKCDTKGRNDPRRRTTFRQSKKKSEKFRLRRDSCASFPATPVGCSALHTETRVGGIVSNGNFSRFFDLQMKF